MYIILDDQDDGTSLLRIQHWVVDMPESFDVIQRDLNKLRNFSKGKSKVLHLQKYSLLLYWSHLTAKQLGGTRSSKLTPTWTCASSVSFSLLLFIASTNCYWCLGLHKQCCWQDEGDDSSFLLCQWHHTCSAGSPVQEREDSRESSKKLWRHQRVWSTSPMRKGWEVELLILEKRWLRGTLPMSSSTWRESAKNIEPGSFQWWPLTGQEVINTNGNTRCAIWIRENTCHTKVTEHCHSCLWSL